MELEGEMRDGEEAATRKGRGYRDPPLTPQTLTHFMNTLITAGLPKLMKTTPPQWEGDESAQEHCDSKHRQHRQAARSKS